MSSPAHGSVPNAPEPGRKRKRLSHACNHCRARKVRCDEAQPKCTNCEKAGTPCITLDPRNPGIQVERREAQRLPHQPDGVNDTSPANSTQILGSDAGQVEHEQDINTISFPPASSAAEIHDDHGELFPALPRQGAACGSSLSMLSQWLDLAFYRLGTPTSFAKDSITVPGGISQPRVRQSAASLFKNIPSSEMRAHIHVYMKGLNSVFPLFQQKTIENLLARKERYDRSGLHEELDMSLVLLLLIVASNSTPTMTMLARACFDVVLDHFRIIMETPSKQAIQAMILCSLIYRWRDDALLASNMISLAASTAQAMGFHRQCSRRQGLVLGEQEVKERASLWFSLYIVEKVISTELGRLSTIRDFECNQKLPSAIGESSAEPQSELFAALVDLARLQSAAVERLADSRHVEENTDDINSGIRSKVVAIGELDQKLLSWFRSLPSYAQDPSNSIGDLEHKLILPFLTLQYWQTIFMLYRNALLLHPDIVTSSAEMFCSDKPYRLRMRGGQGVSLNASRTMVSALSELYEDGEASILTSSYAPLTAAFALGINILRNPVYGLARADAELQATAIQIVAKHQFSTGTYEQPESEALRTLLQRLHTEVNGRLQSRRPVTSERHQRMHSQASVSDTSATVSPMEIAHPSAGSQAHVTMPERIAATAPIYDYSNNMMSWDFPAFEQDINFSGDAFDPLNIDWDQLGLTYGLPSS